MKILHIIWSMTNGGAELLLTDIVNSQINNHEVSLVIINGLFDSDVIERISPSVSTNYLLRKPKSKNPIFLLKMFSLLIKVNPDIIHAHDYDIGKYIKLINIKRIKVVLTIHDIGYPVNCQKNYDLLVSISKSVQSDFLNRGGNNSIVIENGIIFDKIKIKKVFNDTINIVQIGRLNHEKKGQDILIKAFHKLYLFMGCGNLKLTFIGQGESEVYLKQLVSELNIDHLIEFKGKLNREEIYNTLLNYDIVVQPSNWEGFGLSVAEAMAAKLPVLVSDIEGPMEIISGGRYGFYFKSGDYMQCALKLMKIVSLIRTDIKYLVSFTEIARMHIIEQYDIKRTFYKYIKNYQTLLNIQSSSNNVFED